MLLCDFHIHTTFSDGHFSVEEVVDLFGTNGFDAIAISDHTLDAVAEKKRIDLGASYAVGKNEFDEYLAILRTQAQRAIQQYNMLVIPSAEFTNNTDDYHIVGLDIREYIDPSLAPEQLVEQIHAQNAIAIAPHPCRGMLDGTHEFMHLWDNRKKYASIFDAWEIGNRGDLFNEVGLEKLNYVASSDFHYRHHLYSWKTILNCDKNIEAIKQAIRDNNAVGLYQFREDKKFK